MHTRSVLYEKKEKTNISNSTIIQYALKWEVNSKNMYHGNLNNPIPAKKRQTNQIKFDNCSGSGVHLNAH